MSLRELRPPGDILPTHLRPRLPLNEGPSIPRIPHVNGGLEVDGTPDSRTSSHKLGVSWRLAFDESEVQGEVAFYEGNSRSNNGGKLFFGFDVQFLEVRHASGNLLWVDQDVKDVFSWCSNRECPFAMQPLRPYLALLRRRFNALLPT